MSSLSQSVSGSYAVEQAMPKGGLRLGLQLKKEGPLTLMKLARDYGDFIHFPMGKRQIYLVNDPAHAKHILEDRQGHFKKSDGSKKVKDLLGEGLLTAEGELWKRNRRIIGPSFTSSRLNSFVASMTSATTDMIDSWRRNASRGEALDIQEEMMKLTLSISSRALFSTDIQSDFATLRHAFEVSLKHTIKRIHSMVNLPLSVPTPANQQFKKAVAQLDKVVYRLIAERRKRMTEDWNDLLGMLLVATDGETQERLTDKQIRDEILTMILGGYDTAANTLSWTWMLLSKHPQVADRVLQESKEVLGKSESAADMTVEDISKLALCRGVFNETMRLYPPVWVLARQCAQQDSYQDRMIPQNAMVLISPYAIHHNPKLWENPEGFDPDRFLDKEKQVKADFHFLPFGGGPRQCLGMRFAMMEGPLIIAMVAKHFRLDLASWHKVDMAPSITLGTKGGMPMYLTARGGVALT